MIRVCCSSHFRANKKTLYHLLWIFWIDVHCQHLLFRSRPNFYSAAALQIRDNPVWNLTKLRRTAQTTSIQVILEYFDLRIR
ncbi:hypothetical protein FOCC_FOCC014355, partial [Frankliniella occidentalis]